ncbi:TPA: hypothetical protein ACH3X2_001935 [Trebouxia sp. C0005]
MAEPSNPCAICLDELGTNGGVQTLQCGHPFCRTCAARHHETSRQQGRDHRCPLCNTVQETLVVGNDNARRERTQDHRGRGRHHTENLGQFSGTSGPAEHLSTRSGISDLFGVPAVRHSRGTQDRTSIAGIVALMEAQNDIQSSMARIMSIQDRPLARGIQHLELQRTNRQPSNAGHGVAPDLLHFISQAQNCTARLTADFAELVRHSEGQQHPYQQNRWPQLQREERQPRPRSSLGSLNPVLDVLQLFEQLLHEA